jgi:hypothetical protein
LAYGKCASYNSGAAGETLHASRKKKNLSGTCRWAGKFCRSRQRHPKKAQCRVAGWRGVAL